MTRSSLLQIRPKMIFFFLITGLIPMVLTGVIASRSSTAALREQSINQMEIVSELRGGEMEKEMQALFTELELLSRYQEVLRLSEDLIAYHSSNALEMENMDISSPVYRTLKERHQEFLTKEAEAYHLDNIFLLCSMHGHVMYSLSEGREAGSNLRFGPYRDSALSELWHLVMNRKETVYVDFNAYAPAKGEQAAFLGTPVFDERGEVISVIAFQIGTDLIAKILKSRKGMGETGESYLIAFDEETKRFVIRSDIDSMGYAAGDSLTDSLPYWEDALRAGSRGGRGVYIDSFGNPVLVTYSALSFGEISWYQISKIDESEVTAPARELVRFILIIALLMTLLVTMGAFLIAGSLTTPILKGKDFAYRISHGDLNGSIDFENRRDELGELGSSLNEMASQLRLMDRQKRGKEGLDDALRGDWTEKELAERFIRFNCGHLNAVLGAVYLLNGERGELRLTASYAFTDRAGDYRVIQAGEGLIGQAALEREPIYYSRLEEAPALSYGAGEEIPPYFVIAPLLFEDEALGVYFLASSAPFDDPDRQFLRENGGNAAILFNMCRSRDTIKSLLASAQSQQEELRVINEELEQQTRALKVSEEELQAQQEELRVTNEELEERTLALEKQSASISGKNKELRQARDDVEKKARDLEVAGRYKSEFLANMSHELRTPLNSILILSQIIAGNKNGNLTEKQIESAEAIHSSGSDLLKLINEILDLSKVEAGKIELSPEDMSFSAMSSDLMRVFKDLAAEKGIAFEIEETEGIPESLYTDAHRLQQILRNLLNNAFKFTPEGGRVVLKIDLPREDEARRLGRPAEELTALRVRDNGIGIPEDKQAAVFEAFQQADGGTSRRFGGTGLGLSISRELSRLLGGELLLESRENEGSAFSVILPRSGAAPAGSSPVSGKPVAAAPPSSPSADVPGTPSDAGSSAGSSAGPAAPSPAPAAAPAPGSSPAAESGPAFEIPDDRDSIESDDRSILIIEDDPRFIRILKDIAEERGFKCLIAEDGEKGLHFADYYKPKGIILDIGLPGIDGWTVMERLKADPELRHIPVHFMSGSDHALEAMRMGAVGFLTKPVSMEKISEAFGRIETLIDQTVSRLLVVEDDEIQRQSIRDLIGDGDVEIVTVETAAGALERLRDSRFDCMILDLGLQDMSGFELLEKIRGDETLIHVPVIVYTGRDLSREEEQRLQRYSESIIIKGVRSPERLLDETALFLHRVELDLPAEKQKMLNISDDKNAVFRGKKILLVDDDMRNVFALSSILEERELIVEAARNGEEAMSKLDDKTDLVLMDIMMPVMDGYEAMRRIRLQPAYRKLPVIALTAKAMKGDRAKCIEAGASDYLAKPVDTDKLLSMLRVWMYKA